MALRSPWLRSALVAAGLVLLGGPIGHEALAQGTKKTSKKAASKAATAAPARPAAERAGPAKIDTRAPKKADSKRDQLADKKRDEQVEALKRIIPKFEDGNPRKAELLYQLSELYWEKSKYLFRTEMEAYESEYVAYEAALNRGEKQERPVENHRESELFRSETMRLYETILREYPAYERKDEVLFNLAYNQYELGKSPNLMGTPKGKGLTTQAIGRYNELVKNYPSSRLVFDAYVQLGNHYFEANDLIKAKVNFEKARGSKTPTIYSYAVYKLAWCDFNGGEYVGGLAKLHEVVDYSEKQGSLADLKTEALRDSVRFYVQLNQPDDAIAYYKRKAPKKTQGRLISGLAYGLQEGGFHESAIKTFRFLVDDDPMRANAPEFQQAIVKSYEGLRQRDNVRKEIYRLAELYRPGSSWWQANAKSESILRNAFSVTEEAMRTVVTDYHQEAQKTKQVETYRLARDIYKQYVDAFASSEDPNFISDFAFNLRFYYAEILWALEEWETAAKEYEAVVAFKIPARESAQEIADKRFLKNAAFNAILAYEKLVKIERGQLAKSNLKDGDKVDEKKKKGDVEKGKKVVKRSPAELQEKKLTDYEQKLVAVCDSYNALFPKNSDEIDVRYQAAVIYYDANHFIEAAKRFGEIISRFPTEKRSQEAADLSMYVLEEKEEWLELNKLSRQFASNKQLMAGKGGAEFARRVAQVVEGSQYKYVDEVIYKKEKNPAKAAKYFLEFVAEFPKSDNADRALTYAMIIFDDALQLDRGAEVGERVLKEYAESVFELKVRYTLAKFYERMADFQKSASMYEAFIAAYDEASGKGPKNAKTAKKVRAKKAKKATGNVSAEERAALLKEAEAWVADAQFNAALWWEGLGKSEKAIAAYSEYLTRFKDKKDVPEIAFNIALIHEKDQKLAEAIKAFESFNSTFARDSRATPAMHYRAKYRQMRNHQKLKNEKEANRLQEELLKSFAKLPEADRKDDAVVYAYAHVRFNDLDGLWKDYTDIKFNKVATIRKDLTAKQKKIAQIEKAYTNVLAIGAGEWGIAALTRIGMAYADMAQNIIDSPDPKGLDEDQVDMYRAELENLALPLEDKAIEAFEKALEKAYELSVYNEWTLAAQDKINRYRPGSFDKVREVPFRGSDFFVTASRVTTPGETAATAAPAQKPATPATQQPSEKSTTKPASATGNKTESASVGGAQ